MFGISSRATGARSPRGARVLDKVLSSELTQRILRRECARVDRRGGELSLVLFRVKPAGTRPCLSTCRLARTILSRIRETDEAGWFGQHFLAAVLPDTPPSGASAFAEGVCRLVAPRAPKPFVAIFSYPRNWIAPNGLSDASPDLIRVPAVARTLADRLTPVQLGADDNILLTNGRA